MTTYYAGTYATRNARDAAEVARAKMISPYVVVQRASDGKIVTIEVPLTTIRETARQMTITARRMQSRHFAHALGAD